METVNIIEKDFSKICRTCLMEKKKMGYIDTNISEMLSKCTNIMVNKNDGLPEKICAQCLKDIRVSHNFKIQSEKCDRILHSIIDNVKIESNNEEVTEYGQTSVRSITANESCLQPDEIKLENDHNYYEEISTVSSFHEAESNDETFPECKIDVNQTDQNVTENKKNKYLQSVDPIKLENDHDYCEETNTSIVSPFRYERTEISNDDSSNTQKENDCSELCTSSILKENVPKHILKRGKTIYRCDRCKKIFYELAKFGRHLKERHGVEPVKCDKCPKQFPLQIQLDAHMKHHAKKNHVCNTCGKETKSRKALRSHEQSHSSLHYYPCPLCDKSIKFKANLQRHIRKVHQGVQSKRFICPECGQQVLNLKYHIALRHATETPYKCDKCDKAFSRDSFLKQHYKKHTDDAQQNVKLCNICGVKAGNITALSYHMRIHTGERPYKCSTCGKTFRFKCVLTEHQFVHTGEKPHACPLCDKRFTTKKLVRRHQIVHTGERPHSCTVCGRAFGQKSGLKTHMKIHN